VNWRKINPGKLRQIVLLLGLAHGLLYTFLIPPWQHYDEPGHFEYAWLLAHRPGLPQPGDSDSQMHRWVVESMAAHDFYRNLGGPPDLSDPNQEVKIGGYSQLGDPPLYYLFASLPMRLLPENEIEAQLYAGRLVSLAFYLLTLLAACELVDELAGPANRLRLLGPVALALLPGLADLMTAVNNDVGAIAAFSWFLWGGVRLIRRGFGFRDFAWCLAALLFGIFTKRTAWIGAPLLLVALLFGLLRGKKAWYAWGALVLAAAALLAGVFSWDGTAAWYTRPGAPARLSPAEGATAPPLGQYAFRVEFTPGDPHPSPFQLLPPESVSALKGHTVTLGAWMWVGGATGGEALASVSLELQPLKVRPIVGYETRTVELTSEPRFYAFSFALPADLSRAWITLAPSSPIVDAAGGKAQATTLFMDGIVLADGEYPLDQAPVFDNEEALLGAWGGRPFTNLLRNASAERGWPQIRLKAEQWGSRLFPDYGYDRPSLALYSLLDTEGARWYYRTLGNVLLQTFWAKFGWGHVPLVGRFAYPFLALFTLLGAAGALYSLIRNLRSDPRCVPISSLFFLGLAAAAVWGLTFVRGSNYLLTGPYYPVARYAYPAVIPTLLLLCAGWLETARAFEARLRWPAWIGSGAVVAIFLCLDILSIASIYLYYSSPDSLPG